MESARLGKFGSKGRANREGAIDPPRERVQPILALFQSNQHAAAAEAARDLLLEYPDSFVLWSLFGAIAAGMGDLGESEKCARYALALNPGDATAHHNLGFVLYSQDKLAAALAAFDKAVEIDPGLVLTHFLRGEILAAAGDLNAAEAAYAVAAKLQPNFAEAHQERGIMLMRMSRFDPAIAALQEALRCNPRLAKAYNALGTMLFYEKEMDVALNVFERALQLDPAITPALPLSLHARAFFCDFTKIEHPPIGVEQIPPFSVLAVEDAPDLQLKRSQSWWLLQCGAIKPLPLPARTRPEWARIRVGYFSSDFHEHATMFLMSGLFREHDRSRFDIFAYSYGKNREGGYLEQMRRQVSAFRDVQSLSDEEIVRIARADDLDIAVDLKGYTADGRSELFRYRLAPVQINYLGYPGSLGAAEIEYIVADPTLITPELRQFYSERVIYLPHSYQPNDNKREVARRSTTRAEHGLPEEAFVFCCFNRSYKIGMREFDIWMRLLGKVPGSVLWLIRTNPHAEQNLRKEAMARGIDPSRLVFANRIAISEHLERHRHADLFMDTFNYNAHTTASDSLWAGVPIVTKCGQQFAARVGASLLTAVGLPQLIAETKEEYEQKALALALQPRVLNAAKMRLAANRSSCPLFDTVRYTRNFEHGLLLAHERYRSGQKPADIAVRDIDPLTT